MVLEAARNQGKRNIELLIATSHPQPPVRAVLRKVPATQVVGRVTAAAAPPSITAPGGDRRCSNQPTTVRNIELRCRAHNQYEAVLFFGEGSDVVDHRRSDGRARITVNRLFRGRVRAWRLCRSLVGPPLASKPLGRQPVERS